LLFYIYWVEGIKGRYPGAEEGRDESREDSGEDSREDYHLFLTTVIRTDHDHSCKRKFRAKIFCKD